MQGQVRDIKELDNIARELRIDILRMLNRAGSGHTGGSLSAIDIITTLFFRIMRHNPQEPKWRDRDRFVLSKGHAAPALYATLARCGYFPREDLFFLRRLGAHLQGHPASRLTPGVEVSTGSLGQGLSQANGIALAAKLDGRSYRVYVLLGDGEMQEGQVWEAAMFAPQHSLDNLCAFVDHNRLQIDGPVKDIKNIEPLAERWRVFGWHTQEIEGHNFPQIIEAVERAQREKGRPSMIIAHTIKGKGVSIFENKVKYHGIAPSDEELEIALGELKR